MSARSLPPSRPNETQFQVGLIVTRKLRYCSTILWYAYQADPYGEVLPEQKRKRKSSEAEILLVSVWNGPTDPYGWHRNGKQLVNDFFRDSEPPLIRFTVSITEIHPVSVRTKRPRRTRRQRQRLTTLLLYSYQSSCHCQLPVLVSLHPTSTIANGTSVVVAVSTIGGRC